MPDQHERTSAGLRIRLEGSVQGVGFRPWVHGLARRQKLRGCIWNDSDSVTIEAFGPSASLRRFVDVLRRPPMPAARVQDLRSEPIPFQPHERFAIVDSRSEGPRQPSIPPDLALCEDCRREILDPRDRRHGYAFTNCTRCGPRYTIALDVPYDRERTSMASFAMCDACRAEYEDPGDRRFHAQPNACPHCGPRLELVDGAGSRIAGDPLLVAAALLGAGRIVAVKGLGGYHLACDARSEVAVARLRARKHRPSRPLAVMAASLAQASRLAVLDARESELLQSPARPIVLAERRADSSLAGAVSQESPLVGLLLPYTPLHELLMNAFGGPLVMTSGNRSDEPMVTEDAEALAILGAGIADALLRHDRAIVARCDDSIVRVVAGDPVALRRARGMVPESLRVARGFPVPLVACGAHLKNAFCFASGSRAWLGPHVGDLETDEACRDFEASIGRFSRFVGIEPEAVAHDLHPDYFSTRWAASREGLVRVAVQHHHAHAVAVMAEHELDGPAIALAWDGTGDGGDGTAWGGELLVADHAGFRRLASLRPLPLAGGDTAIREVWRLALALVDDAFGGEAPLAGLRLFDGIGAERIALVRSMKGCGLNAPLVHGAGRYFDAFGALILARPVSRHEGEVAAALEFAATAAERRSYPFAIHEANGAPATADLRPAVRAAVADLRGGVAPDLLAARFHATMNAVADAMVALAVREVGSLPVVLAGGCFQNGRLLRDVGSTLARRAQVFTASRIPPNDGGLALGQVVVAAAVLRGDASRLGPGSRSAEVH